MNNIHLIGAEQAQNAAYQMRDAVEQFKLAVGWLDEILTAHARRQEEFIQRFENAVAAMRAAEAEGDA